MDNQQPTNQEILEAINVFSSNTDKEFLGIKAIMVTKDEFKAELAKLVTKDELKNEIAMLETRMVSKEFFVDKLSDFRGELVVLLRKGDDKLGALAGKLLKHKVLPAKEVQDILAMEPFPTSR